MRKYTGRIAYICDSKEYTEWNCFYEPKDLQEVMEWMNSRVAELLEKSNVFIMTVEAYVVI